MEGFGKKTRAILAAGMIAGGGIEDGNSQEQNENIERYSPKYKGAIAEMYERVETLDVEFGAVRVLYQNNTERFYWVKGFDTGVYFDPKRIQNIIDKNPQEVELIHTHHNDLEKILDPEDSENIRPFPPSIIDFQSALSAQEQFPYQKFKHKVIDNEHVWSYDIDFNNQAIKDLISFKNEHYEDYFDILVQNVINEKNEENTFPEIYNKKKDEEDLTRKYPQFKYLIDFSAKISATLEHKDNPWPDIEEYIKNCKELGINIEYESVNNFKKK